MRITVFVKMFFRSSTIAFKVSHLGVLEILKVRPHIITTPMLAYRQYLRFVSTYEDLVTINGKYNKEQICL